MIGALQQRSKQLLVGMIMLTACTESLPAQIYTDVTRELGISHTFGQDAFGGGVSFYDFDQDGWDDITLATQQGDSVVFYRNNGNGFDEVYFDGVHHAGHVKQILWCDYDNDGDKDLYISGRSWDNYIYINDGAFSFTPYLLPPTPPFATGDTYSAAFGDFDLDGDLDLFIANRIGSIPLPNQLFRNEGDGTMTDITSDFEFDTTYQLTFCAYWVDYNNDLLPDLYTAEDRHFVNKLYRNTGDGLLRDDCNDCGAEIVIEAMSVSPGDYDNDGDLDIYVSNTEAGNALLHNNGDGTFTDTAMALGVGYYQVAWGSTFFDYDHDRDLDLYVSGSTNGTTMRNQLYENLDLTSFTEATAGFVGDSTRSFSHAIGDLDNDGYYDIAVLNIDPDSSQVWRSSGGQNNWIKIELEGTLSNREGVGSWIEVWTEGERQVKYTMCGVGYLAQNSSREIFGLAQASSIDSIIVRWTSGVVDKLCDVASNQLVKITEGTHNCTSTSVRSTQYSDVTVYPNPTSGRVTLDWQLQQFEDAELILVSAQGDRISLKDRVKHQLPQITIDLNGLPAGSYLFIARSSNHREIARIVKLH